MRKDLKQHLIAGVLIALFQAWVLTMWLPVLPLFAAFLGAVGAAAVGWAKEYLYDAKHPDKHTVDKKDLWFTAAGGVLGALLFLLIDHFMG